MKKKTNLSIEIMSSLYDEYKEDLLRTFTNQEKFNKKFNLKWYQENLYLNYLLYRNQNFSVKAVLNTGEMARISPPSYDDLEAEITYLLIRKFKPENVVEISPSSGWSSSWILSALKDNGTGFLISFDLVDYSRKMLPVDLTNKRWRLVLGDVRQQTKQIPSSIDYLLIDSDHSASFAEWYIQNIFPLVRPRSPVSVHDIYLRKKIYGEISVILKWLEDKRINYVSPSKYAPASVNLRSKLLEARKKAGLRKFISRSKIDPSIFFLFDEN